MTTDIEQALSEHGPLPRFGTGYIGYIDCACGWEAPRAGVIVWWTVHMTEPMQAIARQAAIGAAVERLDCLTLIEYDPSATDAPWWVQVRFVRAHAGDTLDAAIAAALEATR